MIGGLDLQLTVTGSRRDLDPVREGKRRRVDVDRGAEAGGLPTDIGAVHAPTRGTDEQAVDRQAVVIGPQWKAVEVDVDSAGAIAARRQAVRPRSEQRKSRRTARPQLGDAAGKGEVLASGELQGHAGHPDAGEKRGRQPAGGQGDPRLAAESDLLGAHRHNRHVTRSGSSVEKMPRTAAASEVLDCVGVLHWAGLNTWVCAGIAFVVGHEAPISTVG